MPLYKHVYIHAVSAVYGLVLPSFLLSYFSLTFVSIVGMIRDMLPASVKKMIRRKSLQYSIDQDDPTTEQYIYRRHVVGLDLGLAL